MNSKKLKYIAFLSALAMSSSAAFSSSTIQRINHPNGPATFVVKPSSQNETIAVFSNGQGIAQNRGTSTRSKESAVRVNRGRGQEVVIRSAR